MELKNYILEKLDRTNVNIMVGRFQPYTNGHAKCVDFAFESKGVPTVLCIIETTKSDAKHPFLTEELWSMYQELVESTPNIIDIIKIKSADINIIKEKLNDMGYNPVSWTCGSDRIKDYRRLATNYAPSIEVLEISRTDEAISATQVREAIKQDDKQVFESLTPECLHNYYGYFKEVLEKM